MYFVALLSLDSSTFDHVRLDFTRHRIQFICIPNAWIQMWDEGFPRKISLSDKNTVNDTKMRRWYKVLLRIKKGDAKNSMIS